MKFLDTFMGMLENHGKYRTMALLRRMPEDQLRDVGISPELLAAGVKAWPWQQPSAADYMPASLRRMTLAPVKVEDVNNVVTFQEGAAVQLEDQKSAA